MYSAIPVKCLNWTKENLRHAMLFFPVVGILCAAGTALLWMICQLLHCKALLFAVLAVTGMVFLTGGIHLDGFCDTADALYSRRPQEEKLRILKDPNCGPFAVFSVILVFLLQTAAYDTLYTANSLSICGLLAGGFWISRCLSGFSVTRFSCAPTSSLAKTFGENAGKHVSLGLMLELSAAAVCLLVFYRWIALILLGLSGVLFWGYYRMQKKQFGGMTGDLAGFFLVICETVWLLITALRQSADQFANGSGNRCTGKPPAKDSDEQKIQHNVRDAGSEDDV